ncbi:PP0621 family protein [Achromobacter sp. NPDC058515]|uniref:PP0621 family protein n=1 Tax=Achromobacter sp. NPDC058515 TaxID=3346533 RepID=UPI0036530F2B
MGKLLFWIVLIILVLFVARIAGRMAAARQSGAQAGKAKKPAGGQPQQPKPLESMVRCAHCGIHLPRSEALLQNGQTWCGPDHARLGPGKR